ncbi:putative pre-16S rRNA nuclease [Alicyclobacillus cellulosilyticus]|uniref:Putative pre-16S rRNA nuclease n=1 Tax=Alicyclobacillus cellulosilyticus TaxID=1003997 RepID=A0A917NMJ0_9BACL|nr:Holliday junction resolvase RuvX [Alicyclobacillus cellulosilyticus]GGJ12001.1 putative pre-16S rRNA nuclease [Alicyclobacillus cellulosilyticus]
MRILAVDYGQARIGLALSDPTGMVAQALAVLPRRSDAEAAAEVARLAQDHGVERIVVGLPRNMDGSEGETAARCRRFARQLTAASGLPVEMYDERLTTAAAERMLVAADVGRRKRRQVLDAVAATLLLQGYLDARRAKGEADGRA